MRRVRRGCAGWMRRAEILMVERGPYVSYANCGLPYHVGGVIPKESSLLVASEPLFRVHFAIEVRTNCEAISISPQKKTVDLRNVKTGEITTESLRQARAVAWRAFGPSALARYRFAGDLPCEDRAGCADDPRVGGTWHDVPDGYVQLLGNPDGQAGAACGGGRRRIHRSRDGGEPGACRF